MAGMGSTRGGIRRLAALAVCALVIGAVAPLIGAPRAASAAPKPRVAAPVVTAFSATPASLGASGGTVVLKDTVTGATSCVVSSVPSVSHLPVTVPCANGSTSVALPANAAKKPKHYTFTLAATGSKRVKAKAKVVVAGAPGPSVSGFRATPSPIPFTGGTLHLSATLGGASTCTVSVKPALTGLPATVSCALGTFSKAVTVPANPGTAARSFTFSLTAVGTKKLTAPPLVVSQAAPPGPAVVSFSASPTALGAAGGAVVLSATVTSVSSCTFSSVPSLAGLPATVPCTSGSAAKTVNVPANTNGTPRTYTFSLVAKGATKTVTATPVTLSEAGPPAPTVVSFTATPGALGSSGGTVTLSGAASNAASCTFSSSPSLTGLPKTVSCPSGSVSTTVTLPANSTSSTESYSFDLAATGNGTTNSMPVTVGVAGTGPQPIVHVSGTLTANTTWSPLLASAYVGCLDIPSSVTLTVKPGTVVKADGCTITVEGTLDAVGSSSAPITFTSINDNSVGGTTGSASPQAGDWNGIQVLDPGSIDIEYAHLSYAGSAIASDSFTSGSQTVRNDSFASVGAAVDLNGPAPVVEDNSAVGVVDYAYRVDSASLNFGLIGSNTATSPSRGALFYVGGTLGGSSMMAAQAIPWILDNQIFVPSGLTLTIASGEVIKASGGEITVEGTLDAVGSSSAPITFTSINDNSVGGTTGSASPQAGDWNGIQVLDPGSIDIEYAHLSYAGSAIASDSFTSGSQTVRNDSFASVGAAVDLNGPAPVVEDNSAVGVVDYAYRVDSASLNFGLIGSNTATSPSRGALFYVGGTLGGSSMMAAQAIPWILDNQIFVPSGLTLTIASGEVIKASGGEITVEGTLDAVGSSSAPITFTSINDNSVGGTTGSASPQAGDWNGIQVLDPGSIDIEYAHLSYAGSAIASDSFTSGSQTVRNDSFASVGAAVDLNGPAPVVEDNSAVGVVDYAYRVDSASLNFGLIGSNTATSPSRGALFYVGGTLGGSSMMAAQAIPWILDNQIFVPSGLTLTIASGEVIKASGGEITVEGTLDAVGSSSAPITFTSINDNSVGGTTGSASPQAGDWNGIQVLDPGSIDIECAHLSYAGSAIASDSFTSGSQTVRNDSFASVGAAVDLNGPAPVVEDNSAVGVVDYAYRVDSASLNFGLIGSNTATSPSRGALFYVGGTLGGSSMMAAQAIPWILDNQIFVPSGLTLTIASGEVIKASGGEITVEGTLDAVGSSSAPITFTSINDNSVGGTTGSASPQAGDWNGISVDSGGVGDLEGVDIRYASTALTVSDTAGGAVLHGSVVTSGFGVAGGSDVYVDATEVDWGDLSGPSPIGTGVGFSGVAVQVAPWVGAVEPAPPSNPTQYVPPTNYDCTDIAFIGARGSGEDPQGQDSIDSASDENLFGTRVDGIYQRLVSQLHRLGQFPTIKPLGVRYEAAGATDPLNYLDGEFFNSIWDGVSLLEGMIRDENQHCPDEQIVLAGYSQGALVIHLALRDLAQSAPSLIGSSHLIGVALVADPAKVGHGAEETWENDPNLYANYEAGTGVTKADGMWTKFNYQPQGALPGSVTSQTIAFCHNHDPVCAPGNDLADDLLLRVSQHTSYSQSEMSAMADWLYDKYYGLPYFPSGQ